MKRSPRLGKEKKTMEGGNTGGGNVGGSVSGRKKKMGRDQGHEQRGEIPQGGNTKKRLKKPSTKKRGGAIRTGWRLMEGGKRKEWT